LGALTDPPIWAFLHLRTDSGGHLDFLERRYLEDIIADERPAHVCVACAQSGKTITYLSKTWHRLLHPRSSEFIPTAIYTFPTASDVSEFSKARAKLMIEASPLLSQEIGNVYTSELMLGKSGWTIYFRGTKTDRAALSIPAGMLVHDELDRSQPDTLQMFSDRVRASADPHRFLFSTPTVPRFGVSAEWEFSDQAEWQWECGECKADQVFAPMDRSVHWTAHLDRDGRRFACCHCGATVNREWVTAGRWVRMAASEVAGYHITGIMPPMASAERLCAELVRATFNEIFVQGHIGLPEVSGDKQLTDDVIAFGDWPNALKHDGPCYAGLDQGKKLDLVVGDGKGRIVAVCRYDDWSEVHSAMVAYNIKRIVCDSQPDSRPVQDMVARFPRRVLLADYSLRTVQQEPFEVMGDEPRVRIHRTGILDWGRDRILAGPVDGDCWPKLSFGLEQELKAQLTAPQRTMVKDGHGQLTAQWVETTPDHLRHAHGYYLVACAGAEEDPWIVF
jgi:hypothetical protein